MHRLQFDRTLLCLFNYKRPVVGASLTLTLVVVGVRRMNEVNPRRARLVPGWVIVFGRVYHLLSERVESRENLPNVRRRNTSIKITQTETSFNCNANQLLVSLCKLLFGINLVYFRNVTINRLFSGLFFSDFGSVF